MKTSEMLVLKTACLDILAPSSEKIHKHSSDALAHPFRHERENHSRVFDWCIVAARSATQGDQCGTLLT